eukprot:3549082-Alexandrium_andersonii.AAC.1
MCFNGYRGRVCAQIRCEGGQAATFDVRRGEIQISVVVVYLAPSAREAERMKVRVWSFEQAVSLGNGAR